MDYRQRAAQYAQRFGVSPDLFQRVIQQESAWNPQARSPVGAYGLTQIMPATARAPGFGVAPVRNIEDPDDQLRFGAEYLSAMLNRYDGDERKALAAYNWGAGNADRWDGNTANLPEETRGYLGNILGGQTMRPTMSAQNQPRGQGIIPGRQQVPQDMPRGQQVAQGLAMAFNQLRSRPDQNLGRNFALQNEQQSNKQAKNRTVEWLRSQGRDDLAEAVAAGSIGAKEAFQVAMAPAQDDRTALIKNYEYFLSQGKSPEEAAQLARGGQTINVNSGAPMDAYLYGSDGGVPAGWRVSRETGEASRIPGGPAAAEAESAEEKQGMVEEQTARAGNIVLEDIGRVRGMLTGGRNQPVTGTAGALASRVPGTEAADARALTETIKANIGFDRLQQMRDSSPTGGALGQVTERELATLQAVLGNLEFSQSKEQILRNLDRLEEVYTGILEKASAYPNAAQFGFEGAAPQQGGDDDLTPEERRYLGLE